MLWRGARVEFMLGPSMFFHFLFGTRRLRFIIGRMPVSLGRRRTWLNPRVRESRILRASLRFISLNMLAFRVAIAGSARVRQTSWRK